MWMFIASLLCLVVGAGGAASPVAALTVAQRCAAAKLKEAGKYGTCRLRAEARSVQTGEPPESAKCDERLAARWGAIELLGAGQCPSDGDQTAIQSFVGQHTDALAVALGGGPLPDCAAQLATCVADRDACAAGRDACVADLGTCGTDLAQCAATVASVGAGSAGAAQVLTGATFSSGSGVGLVGSMPDRGAVQIVPGAGAQAIAAGYHDGTGVVTGDADLAAGNIRGGVEVFGVAGTFVGAQALQTGETAPYGAGSDGDLRPGVARAYVDNGDGTVSDLATGLMWEKKSDDGGIHDKDNPYFWGMYQSPYLMNGQVVTAFLATLNAGSGFAGHTDWRIPSRFELETILDLGAFNPAVGSAFNANCVPGCGITVCSCTLSSYYWSSTTSHSNPGFAWGVFFTDGLVAQIGKGGSNYARAVRGGTP